MPFLSTCSLFFVSFETPTICMIVPAMAAIDPATITAVPTDGSFASVARPASKHAATDLQAYPNQVVVSEVGHAVVEVYNLLPELHGTKRIEGGVKLNALRVCGECYR